MLPHIECEKRGDAMHEWCIGVAGADNVEPRIRAHKPGPAAAELCQRCGFEVIPESLNTAKSIDNRIGEWSARFATTRG